MSLPSQKRSKQAIFFLFAGSMVLEVLIVQSTKFTTQRTTGFLSISYKHLWKICAIDLKHAIDSLLIMLTSKIRKHCGGSRSDTYTILLNSSLLTLNGQLTEGEEYIAHIPRWSSLSKQNFNKLVLLLIYRLLIINAHEVLANSSLGNRI